MRLIVTLAATALCAIALCQGPPARGPMQGYAGGLKASKEDVQKLKGLEKAYRTSKAAYQKNPKDAKLKKAYVKAAVQFGHESMMSPVLDRSIKYKQALAIYREVLKVDPKNPVAKQESELIINIYKSMGRPVPGG